MLRNWTCFEGRRMRENRTRSFILKGLGRGYSGINLYCDYFLNLALTQSVPSQSPCMSAQGLGPWWWCLVSCVPLISLPGPSSRDPGPRRCWQRRPAAADWDLQCFLPGRGRVQQRVGCCVRRWAAEGASTPCGPGRGRPQTPGRLWIPPFAAFRPKYERLTGLTTGACQGCLGPDCLVQPLRWPRPIIKSWRCWENR